MPDASSPESDVILIGAGIMSATLGVFLKELEPSLNIRPRSDISEWSPPMRISRGNRSRR